ncbi:VOC family protein [Nostoc sp. UIC 10890]
MSNNLPAEAAKGFNLAETSMRKESPFVETDGLLLYKEECKTPEFLNSSFCIDIFGEPVVVDHYVLLFPNSETLTEYATTLIKHDAKITEGPGKWPDDFCPEQSLLPEDAGMYFLSALMPSGMILVLLAPNAPDEQIANLFHEQGFNTVHHVAILVDDIYAAAEVWQKKGFVPLSMTPQEDGSLCQWFFRNWAGQIIELICRRWIGKETFSCENIAGLRLSELAA